VRSRVSLFDVDMNPLGLHGIRPLSDRGGAGSSLFDVDMSSLDLHNHDIRPLSDRGGGIMTEGEARQMIVDLLTRGELEPSAMDKALIMQVLDHISLPKSL
jgi:hypothetical protein